MIPAPHGRQGPVPDVGNYAWVEYGMRVGETAHTPDLLKERGIEWLSDWMVDDLPCWMKTRHGPMIAMPYTMELNDVPIWVVQGLSSDELLRRLQATLETFNRELADNPKVLTFGLHPHLVGVSHRANYFARCLDLLLARDDSVFVTGSEIADWFVHEDAGPDFD